MSIRISSEEQLIVEYLEEDSQQRADERITQVGVGDQSAIVKSSASTRYISRVGRLD